MTASIEPISPPMNVTAQRIEELGQIIMLFSEQTEKLQASHDILNTRVKQLQDELSEKNRQLERTNRLAALGEMAAGLAHEIRNPLGGIQLYASMLAQDVADKPESARIVTKIVGGVKRVEELVSQVLHFTREINAHPSECNVAQVVRDAVELAQLKAHNRDIAVTCHAPEMMMYRVDDRLLSQAIINLVHNAIEAIEGQGAVSVSLSQIDEKMVLKVQDTGPGMKSETLDRIFNPFFTTKDEGTGLGLAIVHRIVEAHGGSISAGNHADGGAVFEVKI